MSVTIQRPKLRGNALTCFTKHHFGILIQTRLGSISLRTRSNRRVAFKLLWRFLLTSRSFVQTYNRFIVPYPLIMGRLVYGEDEIVVERLFGRRFKLPIHVYNVLVDRRRLPLFTDSMVTGFDQINSSWEVPAREFRWFCPNITTNSYSIDKFNPYVTNFFIESSTLALEWSFDILHSINKIFPSVKRVHLRYYHLPQTSNEILNCFLEENRHHTEFIEFVTKLKADQLSVEEFMTSFTRLISEKLPAIQFWIDIVWPTEGCNLVVANAMVSKSMRNAHNENNLRIDLFRITPDFDLLRKMRPTRERKRPAEYEEYSSDYGFKRRRCKQESKSIVERMTNAVYARMNVAGTQKRAKKAAQQQAGSIRRRPTQRTLKAKQKLPAEAIQQQLSKVRQTPVQINQEPTSSAKPEEALSGKPKLRRSIVMETFTQFFINRATVAGKEAPVKDRGQPSVYRGGHKLWRMLLVHQDFSFFLRRYLLKLNLPLTNTLFFNKDRYILRGFFGFGCRLTPKVMKILLPRLPLFDTIQAKSFEDSHIAWSIPAKVIRATIVDLDSLMQSTHLKFDFCNKFPSEIQIVLLPDSIEYGLQLLTRLERVFPHLEFVKIVYFHGFPVRKKSLLPLEEKCLNKFVVDLKTDKIGTTEFSETFNQYIFQVYPMVQFKVDVIYQQNTLMSRQMRANNLRRLNGSYIVFMHGPNQITGTLYAAGDENKYSFKYNYESLC